MAEPSVTSIAIYQLRVVLCGVSPLVWAAIACGQPCGGCLTPMADRHAMVDLDELREAVDRVKPTGVSNPTSSTGENSTADCGR